tara:strand:- start:805 stop:1428 length:624 start_codon:yes stop_codon:yes gene_type:complete
MNTTEMLNQIKTLLGAKVNLAQLILDNGTVIESDSFESDSAVFIVSDTDRISLPVGEYTIEDGRMLVVTEEGVISEIREKMVEEELETEEVIIEAPEEVADEMAKVIEAVVEVVAPIIEEVKAEIEELKRKFESIPEAEEEGYKDGIADQKEDEREKMSSQKSVSRKLKHSPEAKSNKIPMQTLSQNRNMNTTLDRVMAKVSKFNNK